MSRRGSFGPAGAARWSRVALFACALGWATLGCTSSNPTAGSRPGTGAGGSSDAGSVTGGDTATDGAPTADGDAAADAPTSMGDDAATDAPALGDGGRESAPETQPRDGPSGAGADGSCSKTPSGCFCISGGTDRGPLTACSAASVTDGGEQGICCDGTVLCACDAYSCRNDSTSQFCQCSTSFTANMAVTNGPLASECPAPTANQHCCFSRATNTCICSTLDCDPGFAGVPTCSAARVAVCAADSPAISACR